MIWHSLIFALKSLSVQSSSHGILYAHLFPSLLRNSCVGGFENAEFSRLFRLQKRVVQAISLQSCRPAFINIIIIMLLLLLKFRQFNNYPLFIRQALGPEGAVLKRFHCIINVRKIICHFTFVSCIWCNVVLLINK